MSGRGQLRETGSNSTQPLADPFFPDSIDPKISAFSNVIFTSSRSSTERTLDRRTG